MRKLAIVVFSAFAILAAGCQEIETEFSEALYEDAVVVETVYTPSRHELQPGLTAFKVGPGGVDFGGNFGIRVGGRLQVSNVTVPEKFAVVFRCPHGQFIIKRKAVYDQLKDQKGKAVVIAYREVYRTTYDTKNGVRQVVERELADYDFLGATLK